MSVCIVGPSTRFLSGISYYTLRLANALAGSHQVSALLMRQLLPTRFYPGRKRVGTCLTGMKYDPSVHVLDGVDWYWIPSMLRALRFLHSERPDVVVFQWWTGTVLHSYVLLALVAKALGARVVIEFHEVLDTAEASIRLANWYVRLAAPLLVAMADGFVIHSNYDRPHLEQHYRLGSRPVALIPHGPYDHYRAAPGVDFRFAPPSCCNLLFFGVIRPFKGLEDLITAFDSIPAEDIERYWLTVVGETWEGWTLPSDLIARSRYRDRITFVNKYVSDEEVAEFFAGADTVVLPYHRSSASGPLHVSMSHGLPVIVTKVGGLPEAVVDYPGAILVPPKSPPALLKAILQAHSLRGKGFSDPHSWGRTAANYEQLFADMGIPFIASDTAGSDLTRKAASST